MLAFQSINKIYETYKLVVRLKSTVTCIFIAGYQWCDIEKCVKWMVPFAIVIRETGSSKLKHFRGVPAEDAHNIQTHINSLDLLVSTVPCFPDKDLKLPGQPLHCASYRLQMILKRLQFFLIPWKRKIGINGSYLLNII